MFPGLDAARDAADVFLVDECRLERDEGGILDDVLDPATLTLTKPAGDAPTLWTGPCLLSRRGAEVTVDEAGRPVGQLDYRIRFRHDAPVPQAGDRLTMTACHADPTIIGRPLVVTATARASSMLVTRMIFVRDAAPAHPA